MADYACEYPDPAEWLIRGACAEVCTWQGRRCLRLGEGSNDLAFLPDLVLEHGFLEAEVGADGAAYAGLAFRIEDALNYELAYAQPHTSGMWDALQYDPVFHGSNTWQLYHGEAYQRSADVPVGEWFPLRAEFRGDRALLRLGGQPPLLIRPLARGVGAGRVGLWSYRPAHFSRVRIGTATPLLDALGDAAQSAGPAGAFIGEWMLDGFGVIRSEPNGILNLNRYLPASVRKAVVRRDFQLTQRGILRIAAGYSDRLSLKLDGREILAGGNIWHDTPAWEERGYVSPGLPVEVDAEEGAHRLTAELEAVEYFGFGLSICVEGEGIRWAPAATVLE